MINSLETDVIEFIKFPSADVKQRPTCCGNFLVDSRIHGSIYPRQSHCHHRALLLPSGSLSERQFDFCSRCNRTRGTQVHLLSEQQGVLYSVKTEMIFLWLDAKTSPADNPSTVQPLSHPPLNVLKVLGFSLTTDQFCFNRFNL